MARLKPSIPHRLMSIFGIGVFTPELYGSPALSVMKKAKEKYYLKVNFKNLLNLKHLSVYRLDIASLFCINQITNLYGDGFLTIFST